MWARPYPLLPPIPIVVLRGGTENARQRRTRRRSRVRGFVGSGVRGSIPAGLTHLKWDHRPLGSGDEQALISMRTGRLVLAWYQLSASQSSSRAPKLGGAARVSAP